MLNLGLKFLIDQKDMCSVLTTVHVPSHIDLDNLRQKFREKSIIIYEGKGCFKNRVFQVGNIGELSLDDIQFFLSVLKECLEESSQIEKKKLAIANHSNSMNYPINNSSLLSVGDR